LSNTSPTKNGVPWNCQRRGNWWLLFFLHLPALCVSWIAVIRNAQIKGKPAQFLNQSLLVFVNLSTLLYTFWCLLLFSPFLPFVVMHFYLQNINEIPGSFLISQFSWKFCFQKYSMRVYYIRVS
jgi:hypothetical protein